MPTLQLPPPLPSQEPLPPPARTARAQAPAAAWLASAGALLVMVAAAVVVVGQWSHIAPVYKLGGIIAVNAAVLALAALMRQASPVVARALAHLGATMVVPAGVAFVAAAHGTWPAATLFGGACGALACVGQARAWKARWLVVAAEGAAVIGLIGAATLTHIALGYLLAIAAAAALFMRREPTAARFAIATALAPATGIVGSFGIGSGTIVRIGVAGHALTWAAPIAGIVAGAVLLIVARRRQALVAAIAGLASGVTGLAIGLGSVDRPLWFWLSIPGVVLLVVGAVQRIRDPFWAPLTRAIGAAAEASVLIGALPTAIAFLLSRDVGQSFEWTVVCASTAAGMAAVVANRRHLPAWLMNCIPVGMVAALTNVATGVPLVAAAWLTVLAVAVAVQSRCSSFERFVGLALVALAASDASGNTRPLGIALAIAAGAAVAWSTRHLELAQRVGHTMITVLIVAPAIDQLWPSRRWTDVAILAAALAVTAVANLPLVAVAGVASLAASAAIAAGATPTETAVGMLTAAVMLLGTITIVRHALLDALTLGTTIVATLTAAGLNDPFYWSLATGIVGIAMATYGSIRRERELWVIGQIVTVCAGASLVGTSGFGGWIGVRVLGIGIRPEDLAVAAGALALLVAGLWGRRRLPTVSSWVAYGPALLVAGTHLVTSDIAAHQTARLSLTLGLGITSMAIGGWRRLAAPLFIGTALTATALVAATGHRLAALPVWVWIAVGGAALLLLAALIEQRVDDDTTGEPGERLVEAIWNRFA